MLGMSERTLDDAGVMAIERPHPRLLKMYLLQALATTIAFPFVLLPLLFKYHTLRYKLDAEGISASWGILFRREIYLTYRSIQDIHVTRNLFERWLGIGKVEIQTAAGSASSELTIEGLEHWDSVRDFLYTRMRGAKGEAPAGAAAAAPAPVHEDELLALLRAIRAELEGARQALERRA
jgi:putative membrane protein